MRWMSNVLSNWGVKTTLPSGSDIGLTDPDRIVSDSSLSRKSKHSITLSTVRLSSEECEPPCSTRIFHTKKTRYNFTITFNSLSLSEHQSSHRVKSGPYKEARDARSGTGHFPRKRDTMMQRVLKPRLLLTTTLLDKAISSCPWQSFVF